MRLRFLVVAMATTVLCGVACATTVDCATSITNLQMLINATNGNSGGTQNACQIGDLLITGVSYTQGSSSIAASSITTGFVDLPAVNAPGAERGISFTAGWGATDNITITFSGILCYGGGGNPACLTTSPDFVSSATTRINEGQVEQQVPAGVSGGTTTNSITPTGGAALNLNAGPGNNANPQVFFTGATGFTMSLHDAGTGPINEMEGDVEELVGPEPGTMALMGGALLGLAAVSKKIRRKQ